MNPHQMTGLEMMQAFQKGLVPAPGISKTMGMSELVEAEFGRIVMRALADERHTNPLGGVHGGFAATVSPLDQRIRFWLLEKAMGPPIWP